MLDQEKSEASLLNNRVQALEDEIKSLKARNNIIDPMFLLGLGFETAEERDSVQLGFAPDNRLLWRRWRRWGGAAEGMTATTFGGVNYTEIFFRAMSLIFFDASNNPGLLYQGALYPHAQATVEENGRMFGFNADNLTSLLQQGNLPYRTFLRIGGRTGGDEGIYASAAQPGEILWFNYTEHVAVANRLGWTADAAGVDRLVWLTAATVLHEIMHNMAGRHPADVDYTAGSDYASSLPFVAEQAVCRASPYWAEFQANYAAGSWLNPTSQRTCGNG